MERITDKLLNWASILDPKTRHQACETATMPFIYPHMALMPDAHLGLGATVGSVIPTVGAIIPAAVGVDIGCGMAAVRTQFDDDEVQDVEVSTRTYTPKDLRVLHAAISRAVPLSAGARNQALTKTAEVRIRLLEALPGAVQADQVMPGWRHQLGTLGSGNHFIEVSLDEHDCIWLFLHSGSRGVGNRLATKHIQVAKRVCDGVTLPNRDLAYLTEGTDEFAEYLEALNWAQHYAMLNRREMMDRVVDCLTEYMGVTTRRLDEVNCHHNYTSVETHAGRDVYVSRKGAISARLDQPGLIPGSMGDRSYVVSGLGNPDALTSAPHGAGRNHSRSAAKKLFTFDDLTARMKDVAWGESTAFLDEHPDAYKPISTVMDDAKDLVTIVHELRQIVNVKGD